MDDRSGSAKSESPETTAAWDCPNCGAVDNRSHCHVCRHERALSAVAGSPGVPSGWISWYPLGTGGARFVLALALLFLISILFRGCPAR